MSINRIEDKIKGEESFNYEEALRPKPWREWVRKFFLTAVILLTGALGFAIGRLTSAPSGEPVKVELTDTLTNINTSGVGSIATWGATQSGQVVASKSGSKYHFLNCPGAKQIKEENKIYFESPKAAEAAGYSLAQNCQ